MSNLDETVAANLTNVAEATIQKLSDSINQYTASAINSVAIPEFKGAPEEDIYEFIRRFKLATITFSNELKCLALSRAFRGAASVWAKANIKDKIQNGDWKTIKTAMVERFASPNRELRYREKLSKMSFNSQLETLTSYIEGYAECYRKAHPNTTDHDVIMALTVNLPKNILRNLNVLSENWSEATDISTLLKLVKRLEVKILPYDDEEGPTGKVDMASLTKILSELKESIKTAGKKDSENEDKGEIVAALQHNRPQVNNGPPQRTWNREPARYNPYAYRREGERKQVGSNQQRYQNPVPNQLPNNDWKGNYFQKFGNPPGPCRYCGDNKHFNRHCPYMALN